MEHKYRLRRAESLQGNIWWRAFLDDPYYGHCRLKVLEDMLTPSEEPHFLSIPAVKKEQFLYIEDDSLPLLIGTQSGTIPRPGIFNDSKVRVVATLGINLLSGMISGVSITRYEGPKAIEQLHTIPFPQSINMSEILCYPFPEILQVEFGFKKQAPLYSQRAEIARTPVQHFQNMSYREDFVPRKANLGRARSMLLVNEFQGSHPDAPYEQVQGV